MPSFTDQSGRSIRLDHPPQRIISLVPSQTELLHTLGLENEVVGITKFCIHPPSWFHSKTRIGGTKNIHLDIIHRLNPDLIIANKEENVKEQVEELSRFYPVWTSDIHTLPEAIDMIRMIGSLTGKEQQSSSLARDIEDRFEEWQDLRRSGPHPTPLRTAYFIWRNPWMVAGGDTFIHEMLTMAGLNNIFAGMPRYPEIAISDLQHAGCDLVLLSSEPYPFKDRHITGIRTELPDAKILLVDGEMFSWYGSRLLHVPAYFRLLQIHDL